MDVLREDKAHKKTGDCTCIYVCVCVSLNVYPSDGGRKAAVTPGISLRVLLKSAELPAL